MRARLVLRWGALACAVLGCGALAAPGLARAEQGCTRSERAEAAGTKRQALRSMEREPEKAADLLEAAHALCPDPWYLGHLAVLYEELGRVQDAIRSLEGYLASPGVRQREEALAARDRLRALLVVVEVTSDPPGAAVYLDGERAPDAARTPARLELEPGEHSVVLSLDGHETARRDIAPRAGEALQLDVVLEPSGGRPPVLDAPVVPETREEPARGWTGGAQVGLGAFVPLASGELQPFVALGFDVGGGFDFGPARLELVTDLWVTPAPDGVVFLANLGPRAGVRLGALPLWLEAAALVGLCYLRVEADDRQIARGQHLSLGALLGVALSWRLLGWLELVARPARIELIGLAGDSPTGFMARWGFDLSLRFRL